MFVLSDYLHLTELRRAQQGAAQRPASTGDPPQKLEAALQRIQRRRHPGNFICVYEGNRIEIDYLFPEGCRALLGGECIGVPFWVKRKKRAYRKVFNVIR